MSGDGSGGFDMGRHVRAIADLSAPAWNHPRLQTALKRAARDLPVLAGTVERDQWCRLELPVDRVARIPAGRIERAPLTEETAARIAPAPSPEDRAAVRCLADALVRGCAGPEHVINAHAAVLPWAAGLRSRDVRIVRADGSVAASGAPASACHEGLRLIVAIANAAVSRGDAASLVGCYGALHLLHPFADGNGRASRRLLLAGIGACAGSDLSAIPIDLIVWMNRTYHDYRLHRLRQIDRGAQWDGWVAFVLQMMTHALEHLPDLCSTPGH